MLIFLPFEDIGNVEESVSNYIIACFDLITEIFFMKDYMSGRKITPKF